MVSINSYVHRIFGILSIFFLTVSLIYCSSKEINEKRNESQQAAKRAHENTPELADAMGQLQRYAHKYTLSVEAENHELATFYFHEVRAAVDGIKKEIPGYEGYDIARFMKLFLDPTLEPVETALGNHNWDQVRKKTVVMINACNSCHNATSHGFINITPGFSTNPFNQDFSAPD